MAVEIQGGRQLRKSLKEAGDDLGDLQDSHKQAATIAANASADLAPRITGRLSRTIRAAGTKSAGIVRAGTKAVPYGPAVHWGRLFWPNRSSTPRYRSVVRAQPFISEGARNSEGQWLPVYERALDDSIQRVKGI